MVISTMFLIIQERDSAVAKENELRREIDMLKERLESSQRAWQATRRELEEKESRFYSVESKAKETELFVRNSEMQLRSFKEQLAGLLSDPSFVVEPYEEQIRERIRALMTDYKDRRAVSLDPNIFVFKRGTPILCTRISSLLLFNFGYKLIIHLCSTWSCWKARCVV